MDKISDLTDGVNLGKLVEIACSFGRGDVMNKLRNPGGDRIRKIRNVETVLKLASEAGVDTGSRHKAITLCFLDIKPDAVVGGNKDVILEILWRIIGVFVVCLILHFFKLMNR